MSDAPSQPEIVCIHWLAPVLYAYVAVHPASGVVIEADWKTTSSIVIG